MIWLLLLSYLLWFIWVCNGTLWQACFVRKDGGPESRVVGYWLFECKWLFSVALLRFDPGSREVHHSHAFNAISWVLGRGELREEHLMGLVEYHRRSFRPVLTWRGTFHQVFSEGITWVLTFRGPWRNTWYEYDETTRVTTRLAQGRHVVWTSDSPALLT